MILADIRFRVWVICPPCQNNTATQCPYNVQRDMETLFTLILFTGTCTAIGGYRYALWFVGRRSKHIKQYPLKYLASDELIKALRIFRRDMGGRYQDKMI